MKLFIFDLIFFFTLTLVNDMLIQSSAFKVIRYYFLLAFLHRNLFFLYFFPFFRVQQHLNLSLQSLFQKSFFLLHNKIFVKDCDKLPFKICSLFIKFHQNFLILLGNNLRNRGCLCQNKVVILLEEVSEVIYPSFCVFN